MEFAITLIIVISLILFGLLRSTESVLEIRQKRRDQGEDPKVYL
jgi:hypothetical protein